MLTPEEKNQELQWNRRAKRTAIIVTLVCMIFLLVVYRDALRYATFWEGAVLGAVAAYIYSVLSFRYHRILGVIAATIGVGFLVAVMLDDIPPMQGSFRSFLGGLGLGCALSSLIFVFRQTIE